MNGYSQCGISGLAVLCLLFFGLVGCGRDEGGAPQLTRTEQLRLRLDPLVASYMVRSEQAFLRGNYNLAFAYTDSAEFIMPELADIPYMRGRIYTKLNLIESSSREYQQVVALDPDYKGARYNMGLNAFQRGLLREAVDFFKEEEAINPAPIVYLEMGKVYARLGEPDSARMAYEKAIEGDPTDASAYMWIGQLFEEIGDLDKALEYSHKGISIKPGDPNYEYILGTQYLRKGDDEKAIEYLRPVAESLPWHQGAQYNLGQALMRQGRAEEAQRYFALADTAQQMQQALNEAQNALDTDPDDRDKWVHRADLLWKTGNRTEAIEAYMVALSIDPMNYAMHNNLASMLIESGRVEAGINRLEAILRVNPDFVGAWLNLGAAYANQGDYELARNAWENALKNDPGNSQAKAFLKQLEVHEIENPVVQD